MVVRYKVALVVCFCLLVGYRLVGQTTASETTEEVLRKGSIVSSNIQEAITEHLTLDHNFKVAKQLPEQRHELPPLLVYKNGDIDFDWTPGQQARFIMEDIRQGLHALQAAEKPTGFDVIALAGGREMWPKLRDISCREKPSLRYYDLDGFEQYCPAK
jgi:hypothetical protein